MNYLEAIQNLMQQSGKKRKPYNVEPNPMANYYDPVTNPNASKRSRSATGSMRRGSRKYAESMLPFAQTQLMGGGYRPDIPAGDLQSMMDTLSWKKPKPHSYYNMLNTQSGMPTSPQMPYDPYGGFKPGLQPFGPGAGTNNRNPGTMLLRRFLGR